MTRIVFSRDRPAQLDLLLRSIERHCPEEDTDVIWHASGPEFIRGYGMVCVHPAMQEYGIYDFEFLLREALDQADQTVTFFCDDDVVYRDDPGHTHELDDPEVLCFSMRLGRDNKRSKPPRFPRWNWTKMRPTDFGFPGSIDGHTFRRDDVLEMLGAHPIANPTQLETVLARRVGNLKATRPFMMSYQRQVLVGVPVNRVSEDSGVANGDKYPQDVAEMNRRFLSGERIDLDALDFSWVRGCHHEIQYQWK